MSDLIERLRKNLRDWTVDGKTKGYQDALSLEAADEIERLECRVGYLEYVSRELTEENEGLRNERAMVALSASEQACYQWPDDTELHRSCRAAYIAGAMDYAALKR